MSNEERDKLIMEMHTDIKWIKEYINDQKQYKLLVWGALITAILGLICNLA